MQSVTRLYDRRLIEALDPNAKQISIADKIAIKDSGMAHIELLLNSTVYVEQMAIVTGVNEVFVRDEMRRNMPTNLNEVREVFLRYALKIDAGRVGLPTNQVYAQLAMARRQIESLTSTRRRNAQTSGS